MKPELNEAQNYDSNFPTFTEVDLPTDINLPLDSSKPREP